MDERKRCREGELRRGEAEKGGRDKVVVEMRQRRGRRDKVVVEGRRSKRGSVVVEGRIKIGF